MKKTFLTKFIQNHLNRRQTSFFKLFAPIALPFILTQCVNMGDFFSDADCVKDVNSRAVSFTRDVQPVLQKSCVGCHSNMGNATQYRVNYYPNSGLNSSTSRINLPISDSKHMPTGSNLTACKALIIKKWETDGYAN